jgi:hypothetical protein
VKITSIFDEAQLFAQAIASGPTVLFAGLSTEELSWAQFMGVSIYCYK